MNGDGVNPVNMDAYLARDKFNVDEDNAHIALASMVSAAEFLKLVRICPAGLYTLSEDGTQSFDYAGCLECGSCRIVCGDTAIRSWKYPGPGWGVEYRYG
jgi:ferredoxin-like protein FixX